MTQHAQTIIEVNNAIEDATGGLYGVDDVTGVEIGYVLGRDTRDGFPRWAVAGVVSGASHALRTFHPRGKQAAVLYAEEVASVLGVPVL